MYVNCEALLTTHRALTPVPSSQTVMHLNSQETIEMGLLDCLKAFLIMLTSLLDVRLPFPIWITIGSRHLSSVNQRACVRGVSGGERCR